MTNDFKTQEVPAKLIGIITKPRNQVLEVDDFHVSYLPESSDYDNKETTALVFTRAGISFILNGNHKENYLNNSNSFRESLDYFLDNLDQVSKMSEHRYAARLGRNDLFNLGKQCKEYMGSELYKYFCKRVKQFNRVDKEI